MNTIFAMNIPRAYSEAIIKMRVWGEEEQSRNGPVITSLDPVLLHVARPMERVLFDGVRDCNPFFHVMEFVWMIAGENDVRWIEQFNKGFRQYADVRTNNLHGAYGWRWIKHFGTNQIQAAADLLAKDATTRRAVIGMWDPRVDLVPHADLPCNTQIMFRYVSGQLDMTVINRSNDLVWGMLGANAVHMTYLHELMCHMTGMKIGFYKVFTNNLHIYKEMPKFDAIWGTCAPVDEYSTVKPYPLLDDTETYEMLVSDCVNLINEGEQWIPKTDWMRFVARPMYMAYMERLHGGTGKCYIDEIEATDWRLACEQYVNRRKAK